MDAIDYAKSYRPAGSPVQEVIDPMLKDAGIRLLIKRDDLIHQHISGNKWRKLKYNLAEAAGQNHHTILTFGGAYSNHIAATAFACKKVGLESIGIIRGEDDATNPTLTFARANGMQLQFVSREEYRMLTHPRSASGASPSLDKRGGAAPWRGGGEFEQRFGRCFIIPVGGANGLGVRGCAEILPEIDEEFDIVCCAAGTGTTLAGLALTLKAHQQLFGFPALKGGEFLKDEVERLIRGSNLRPPTTVNFQLMTDYHFGGYAKVSPELLNFIRGFTQRTGIPLDPIYTGKMMFGIYDMIRVGAHDHTPLQKGTTILAIHTGGLQGWMGMQHRGMV